ncbi:MAG: hypothetical protein D6715_03220 [Calditrichaeota bacterium]|nr:MAG: hypothetical protein D6715_03220 [Calditrichota bacterium]
MNKRGLVFLFLVALGGTVGLLLLFQPKAHSAHYPESNFFEKADLNWIRNPYWFDGKAEVNFYQTTLVKYGIPRQADPTVHILVAEKHRPDVLVKANEWRQHHLVDMLKFNQVVSVQTGIYAYRQMMSVFFQMVNSRTAKMTFTSHEWCGNAFKSLVNFRGRRKYYFDTYWDGQGHGEYPADFPEDVVLYDALPVQLRMLVFRPGEQVTLALLPGQFSSKASKPKVVMAQAEVGKRKTIQVPAGSFSAYPVRVALPEGEDLFWFEAEFPHRMLEWKTHTGNHFQLLKSEKLAYWKLNKPGDEAYLP